MAFTEPNEFPVRVSSPRFRSSYYAEQFPGDFLETPPKTGGGGAPFTGTSSEPIIDFQGRAVSFREGKRCLKNILGCWVVSCIPHH